MVFVAFFSRGLSRGRRTQYELPNRGAQGEHFMAGFWGKLRGTYKSYGGKSRRNDVQLWENIEVQYTPYREKGDAIYLIPVEGTSKQPAPRQTDTFCKKNSLLIMAQARENL